MSRSTSASSATGTATNGLSRNLSVKATAKQTHSANPLPPSDVKLFVTNLRLIDLDLRPDWPGITVQTFSSRNADQKQRISGVEWALFRLFEIWDPEETSQVSGLLYTVNRTYLTVGIEITALLSTARTLTIAEPPRCPLPVPERIEEERHLGS